MSQSVDISVVGASGYTGMEAIRVLKGHPHTTITRLYGGKSAGTKLHEHYKGLEGVVDAPILDFDQLETDSSDAIFLGLPHGKSAEVVKTLLDSGYKGRIIDMSSDFRLRRPDDYEIWYGRAHPHPELLDSFVYGLTEWYRGDIRLAEHIANPGCFATAIQLGLLPFVKEGLVSSCNVTGITGSSGSGSTPSAGTHFSNRFGNVKAYKVYRHQHLGEVNQTLRDYSGESGSRAEGTDTIPDVRFVPVSGPFVRGIWMTLNIALKEEVSAGNLLEEEYYNAPLVRLQEGLPELKQVVGSAFTDIGWIQDGSNVVIGVAIDNLLKGAASQAVQNFNLMLEWPEETGLTFPPTLL